MRAAVPILILSLVPSSAHADEAPAWCGLEDPQVAANAPAVPRKAGEVAGLAAGGVAPVRRVRVPDRLGFEPVGSGQGGGALAGKSVYVSAGHGWTWRTAGNWRTQRGNTHDLVEDFISTEAVSQFLVRYLRNMGAHVVPVRESDWNPNLAVVDDDAIELEGAVAPRADAGAGFGHLALPITGQENPFAAGGARLIDTAANETGRALWVFDVPETGSYNVYASWVQDASRARDAHYIVRHAGGESHYRVDQRRHGGTWVLLGRFWFEAGRSPVYGAVALANDSGDAGATLSIDAARIGGGVGVIDRGGGANGLPMFENNARYHAQLAGAPASVYDYSSDDGSDDVGTRSRFAAWEHEDGEDAVYIAWHTNAPDPARGTSSFVYGPSSFGPLSEFSGTAGSLELVDAVHGSLMSAFRQSWQSDWQDRGMHSAYFGEVNPNHNPEMPAALFEIAFHDTAADAAALRDLSFRRLAARAMAHGVARYFAGADGSELVLPPEPPTAPRAIGGSGSVLLSWSAPAADPAGGDAPAAYRVYLSRDGYGFDDGTDVAGAELAVETSEPVYARITATNAGGESMPTRVVGARPAADGASQVLVVGGFDRFDGSGLIAQDLSDYALATIERGLVERINDRAHVARYGAAIAAARVSFDSVDAAAVGSVDLSSYRLVVWQLGEEGVDGGPLSPEERSAIAAHLDGGGALLLSSTELAWALGDRGTPDDVTYLSEVLHLAYGADDADAYAVEPVAGELFDGLGPIDFGDGGAGGYDADFPDAIEPAAGAVAVLSYTTGATAGVAWREAEALRLLYLGFPFETVVGADRRAEVMARILAGFAIEADPEPEPEPDPDDPPGGCCGAGSQPAGPWLLALALAAALRRRHNRRPCRSP